VRASFDLAWRTPEIWAVRALEDPLALLSDHACCELGAAASAQGLILRGHGGSADVERLAHLAVEELRHFHAVHHLLVRLGGSLAATRASPYTAGLRAGLRSDTPLADRLLVSALIERRSLERFELLAENATGEIGALDAELAPSEAGHAELFVALARKLVGAGCARARLEHLLAREAELVSALPFAPRIHSGPPVEARPASVEAAARARGSSLELAHVGPHTPGAGEGTRAGHARS
jgi:tRNA-(ms[2]io[6]A)-hydroxylase